MAPETKWAVMRPPMTVSAPAETTGYDAIEIRVSVCPFTYGSTVADAREYGRTLELNTHVLRILAHEQQALGHLIHDMVTQLMRKWWEPK